MRPSASPTASGLMFEVDDLRCWLMASGPGPDDEAPSLASRVLDLLDDDLLGQIGDLRAAPETPRCTRFGRRCSSA